MHGVIWSTEQNFPIGRKLLAERVIVMNYVKAMRDGMGVPVVTSLGAMPGLGCLQRCDIALPVWAIGCQFPESPNDSLA